MGGKAEAPLCICFVSTCILLYLPSQQRLFLSHHKIHFGPKKMESPKEKEKGKGKGKEEEREINIRSPPQQERHKFIHRNPFPPSPLTPSR